MFLNQELHEAAGTTVFRFPEARILEWFDHQSRGPSSSFWFHNKFPDKVLSLVIAPVVDNSSGLFSPKPMVFINVKAHESVISWGDEMVTYVGVIKTSILKASGVLVIKQE